MKFKPSDHVKLALILCVTIGLTPYYPMPHSYEKLKWLFDGGNGMQLLDYFDLVFHNLPWLYLIFTTIYWYKKRQEKENYS
ncbi:MAG: hypothetical protein KKE39_04975 [Bacteroidetes bacterium]|nr:hypothetical protein [Bacteroidota bacterium]MBU1373001.1 hypothetical protein [Bacteroidota bacterium]MBU1485444.1 hypothetical protein [Bacteroidota bacterium]MBU1759732.1 hypothetical protein [Bacteroidota bacterium]MBU2046212.1 hypothetical protein [Bacteroidota bacterium]